MRLLTILFLFLATSINAQRATINNGPPTLSANDGAGTIVVGGIPSPLTASQGVVLGNSTIAAFLAQVSVPSLLFTPTEIAAGYSAFSVAVPGETIAQQHTRWNNIANKSQYEWVFVEVGLNNMNPAEAATVPIAEYQSLIDDIRADVPGIKIICSKMTPARQRWIDLYGAINGPIAQQKWVDMNAAMSGFGPNAVTSVDAFVVNHVPLLADSNGNLAAQYDMGDGIHENNAGRQIIATWWRNKLKQLGW